MILPNDRYKFGTKYLITASFSSSTAKMRFWDYTAAPSGTPIASHSYTSTPIQPSLIGFPVTENDILSNLAPSSFPKEDVYFTCDISGGKIKTYQFTQKLLKE